MLFKTNILKTKKECCKYHTRQHITNTHTATEANGGHQTSSLKLKKRKIAANNTNNIQEQKTRKFFKDLKSPEQK